MNAGETGVSARGRIEVSGLGVGGCARGLEVREDDIADAAGLEGTGGLVELEFEVDLAGRVVRQ
jgi:hypothetical protein